MGNICKAQYDTPVSLRPPVCSSDAHMLLPTYCMYVHRSIRTLHYTRTSPSSASADRLTYTYVAYTSVHVYPTQTHAPISFRAPLTHITSRRANSRRPRRDFPFGPDLLTCSFFSSSTRARCPRCSELVRLTRSKKSNVLERGLLGRVGIIGTALEPPGFLVHTRVKLNLPFCRLRP